MNKCKFCNKPAKNKFCSNKCVGLAKRGTGKSYISIRIDGKRIYLHRYVMIAHEYPLKDSHIVHHIDENRHNNSIFNLEVITNKADHLKAHNYYRKNLTQAQIEQENADITEFGW